MYSYKNQGVSIKTVLDKRREYKGCLYKIRIQVIYDRKVWLYTPGKMISESNWEILPTSKSPVIREVREDLQASFELIKKHVRELSNDGKFSFEEMNIRLKSVSADTINALLQYKIDQLNNEGRINSATYYSTILKNIEDYKGNSVQCKNITVSWLKKFENHLRSVGRSETTIAMYQRGLRTIVNMARKRGYIKEKEYPYGQDKYQIVENEGRKLALNIQQIGQVVNYSDGLEATEKYRDIWLFLYLCNGINVVDMLKLKFSNISNGEIHFYRTKTYRTAKRRKEIAATYTSEMKSIVEKWGNPFQNDGYLFPFLKGGETPEDIVLIANDITRRINRRMNKIGKSLGIGSISTYTARHSFATVLKRSGANVAYISESLGHQDIHTTNNYLASFEQEERKKNAALLTQFKDEEKV
ncbi:site-specific integrase [Maribellus sp. YY47]|uniref:tyrosine-type recombinase/integrase n=1 Tax=Maribellus sp. YY47 TaxID=2929486 RepID=UPI002000B315|nr:site-specific integrase [Maribellus sp. YY47]MCK3682804.1 site-specific integrase [Maribellus sp. YY47]